MHEIGDCDSGSSVRSRLAVSTCALDLRSRLAREIWPRWALKMSGHPAILLRYSGNTPAILAPGGLNSSLEAETRAWRPELEPGGLLEAGGLNSSLEA